MTGVINLHNLGQCYKIFQKIKIVESNHSANEINYRKNYYEVQNMLKIINTLTKIKSEM